MRQPIELEATMTFQTGFRTAAAAVVLAATLAVSAGAEDKPSITELHRGPLAADEAIEVTVAEVNYPPGFNSPRHYHTGRVLVYVLNGEGAMEVDGSVRTGGVGAIIEEEPEREMVMSNTSDEDWLHFLVFQVGPAGEPMIVRTD